MDAIKVENLTKKFGSTTAVDGISFSVSSGELFGLLGPNGAGKTTIINMLCTLIQKTSGFATVAGYDVSKHKDMVRKSIGIVFQDPALDGKLTGRENLEFHALMYGLKKEERETRIKEMLMLVELADKADVLVEKYSGGMKRRLEIARGLIHSPKVLFLDEPTLGLDSQTKRHIWEYIRKLNKEKGVTIILTTHYMEEADYLCDRIAIIDFGKIVVLDTPKNLKDVLGGDVITLDIGANAEKLVSTLAKIPWIKKVTASNGTVNLTLEQGEKRIPELCSTAHEIGFTPSAINLHKPSLEDVFLHYTGKTIREKELGKEEMSKEAIRMRMGR